MTIYLVYLKDSRGRVTVLGPAFTERALADSYIDDREEDGWDAYWVGIPLYNEEGTPGGYIVTVLK